MSKSLERVAQALNAAGLTAEIAEMPGETRTAEQAAAAAGCLLDQIAKSIVFQGASSGRIFLFVTAGGNRVDPTKASALAGEPLERADAGAVRASTGFAIGGVAPLGHVQAVATFFDRRLADFDLIWAAAGTPRHIFPVRPTDLVRIIGVELSDFTS